jgi:hypothetical protein
VFVFMRWQQGSVQCVADDVGFTFPLPPTSIAGQVPGT